MSANPRLSPHLEGGSLNPAAAAYAGGQYGYPAAAGARSPGAAMQSGFMSPNAALFQPGMSFTPRGSIGSESGGLQRSNSGHMYGPPQQSPYPFAFQAPHVGSPNVPTASDNAMSMTRGQRAPAPTGLSLNAGAPVFQMGGGSAGGPATFGGKGMASLQVQPISPMIDGAISPAPLPGMSVSPSHRGSMLLPLSPGATSDGRISPNAQHAAKGAIANMGMGWDAGALNGVRGQPPHRRGRGQPPVNQPIRTTGHNSTPSVSLNPAAFAAALAAQKPKRKVVVRLPTEIDGGAPENVFRHTITEENENDAEEAEGDQQRGQKEIRKRWVRREPLKDVDVNEVYGAEFPHESMQSRRAFPTESDKVMGLPDFVDIYLPGQNAWEEVRETFALERKEKEESRAAKELADSSVEKTDNADQSADSLRDLDQGWGLGAGAGDGGTFGLSHPSSVTNATSEMHQSDDDSEVDKPVDKGFKATKADLMALKPATPSKPALHMQSMSLSIPSSGMPFGPSTLTALGLPSPSDVEMERSYSDSEDRGTEPALGARPRIHRLGSEPSHSNNSTPTRPSGGRANLNWRELGRGFGYDIAEADEDALSDQEDAGDEDPTISVRMQRQYSLENMSNASEDADASDQDDEAEDDAVGNSNDPSWLRQRRLMSNRPLSTEHDDEREEDSDEEIVEEDSELDEFMSEEFSNPSDEEAARLQRRLERSKRRKDGVSERKDVNGNRARANTGDTLASSNLGEVWHGNGAHTKHDPHATGTSAQNGEAEDINVMSRGPLDFGATSLRPNNAQGFGSGTLSRAAGSVFRANAPSFTPTNAANAASTTNDSASHFRLPSIPSSSFGQSFKPQSSSRTNSQTANGLNAAAPSFVPGAFTFTAPDNAPKLPQLTGPITAGLRESQGREKRVRHVEGRDVDADKDAEVLSQSPPRPKPSAASFESALRDGTMADGASFAPPFNANKSTDAYQETHQNDLQPQPQPTLGSFSFQPGTYAGYQTIRKSARGGIPNFDAPQDAQPNPPQSDFTFSLPATQNRAVPIRRPDEDGSSFNMTSASGTRPISMQGTSLTHPRHNLSMLTDTSFDADRTFGAAPRGGLPMVSAHRQSVTAPVNEVDEDMIDGESDDGTVSDIIEELGDRMDRALEGWAGKILDEVTIMGQVRPVNMVTLDTVERKTLVEAVGREIGDLLADYHDRLHARLIDVGLDRSQRPALREIAAGDESLLEGDVSFESRGLREGDDTESVVRADKGTTDSGAPDRLAQFDLVQDVLDAKFSNLHRELQAAFDTALPRAMEKVSEQVKGTIDAARIEAALQRLEESHQSSVRAIEEAASVEKEQKEKSAPVPTSIAPVELSAESSDLMASLLIGRLQPVMDELAQQVASTRRSELDNALEPMFEELFTQTKARSEAERQEVVKAINDALDARQQKDTDHLLSEMKDATGDQLEAMVIKSIIPHLETLRPDSNAEADLICGRITEILVPLIARGADDEGRQISETLLPGKLDASEVSMMVVEQLRPILQQASDRQASQDNQPLFDAGEVDHDSLAERIVALLKAKGDVSSPKDVDKAEEGTDLSTVIALLQPIVEKQEEARSLSRKALEKQADIEMSINALPSAVNAKMEVIMATNQSIHDGHDAIVERLNKLVALRESPVQVARSIDVDGEAEQTAVSSTRLQQVEEHRDALLQDVDQARKEAHDAKAELIELRADRAKAAAEVEQLEARLAAAQVRASEAAGEVAQVRQAGERAEEDRQRLERQVLEHTAKCCELEAKSSAQDDHHAALRTHIDQLDREIKAGREERAHERELASQAAAEALARYKRAEEDLVGERARSQTAFEQMQAAETITAEALQRAARAEGEATALEKRVGEQDSKIANLQQLTATQKQKAAQSGQKLSEVEKRLRELEASDRELEVAQIRMSEMENRLRDREEVGLRLRNSMDNEARLRNELAAYQERFLDLERDLMSMRETLVGRDELEQSQADLTGAREEIAELRGQLAERERREQEQEQRRQAEAEKAAAAAAAAATAAATAATANGTLKPSVSANSASWTNRSPSHGSSTWASIYAPNSSQEDDVVDASAPHRLAKSTLFVDDSFASPRRGTSVTSNSRAVECSVDGWWS